MITAVCIVVCIDVFTRTYDCIDLLRHGTILVVDIASISCTKQIF